MKGAIHVALILLLVAVATSEPPRRRFRPFRTFQRQEAAAPEPQEPPYPPSGWKPSKPFYLPGEYGTPAEGEAPPPEEGGEEDAEQAPESTTAPAAEETTTAAPAAPGEEDQQGEGTVNIPQEARNLQAAPVFVVIQEKAVQQPLAYQQQVAYQQPLAYQVYVPGPYAGNYIIQNADPISAQYYGVQGQRLVQILKK